MNTQNNNVAIQLSNVSKKYLIHHEKPTLVERLLKGKNEEFLALKNISLSVKKGERIGVIGANGSGKTTLLKIIAGISSPTGGHVITSGKVVSLIDLGAGFHPDLTGIQNVYLNGAILGMNKNEITKKLNSITNFAGIQQFMDVPLYTYSDGMKFRLGFAIAIHSNPDVVLLDEGIITGDIHFQQKALTKIKEICDKNVTLVIVSQVEGIIRLYAKKIVLMNHGAIEQIGGQSVFTKYARR
jgi:ABC-type polysaccharide/polyol phosphate transport system ATPase subunit